MDKSVFSIAKNDAILSFCPAHRSGIASIWFKCKSNEASWNPRDWEGLFLNLKKYCSGSPILHLPGCNPQINPNFPSLGPTLTGAVSKWMREHRKCRILIFKYIDLSLSSRLWIHLTSVDWVPYNLSIKGSFCMRGEKKTSHDFRVIQDSITLWQRWWMRLFYIRGRNRSTRIAADIRAICFSSLFSQWGTICFHLVNMESSNAVCLLLGDGIVIADCSWHPWWRITGSVKQKWFAIFLRKCDFL